MWFVTLSRQGYQLQVDRVAWRSAHHKRKPVTCQRAAVRLQEQTDGLHRWAVSDPRFKPKRAILLLGRLTATHVGIIDCVVLVHAMIIRDAVFHTVVIQAGMIADASR